MTAAALLALAVIVAAGAWYIGVRLFPWRTCPRCAGRGRIGGVTRGTHRDCGRCGASGRVRRIGARPRE